MQRDVQEEREPGTEGEGRPRGGRRPFIGAAADDAVIEGLVERIVREAAARPLICPWCCATLPADAEGFCNSHCAEQYRKIMPPRGLEQVGISRPLSGGVKATLVKASSMARLRRRAQQAAAR